VPLLVAFRVEGGWPAAVGAFGFAVGVLVGLGRDARLDPASAQVGPVGLGRVCPVCQDSVRAGAGVPTGRAGDPDLVQDLGELRAVTPLPGGEHHG
jgi:hypothetical protein